MPYLGVAVLGGTGQVVEEPAGSGDRVAVSVKAPCGEVVGVGVHADHALGESGFEWDGRGGRDLSGGVHVPAPAPGVDGGPPE
ncbi:hypothetical protein GCM10017771_87730 [Streptomyces capitiformicae]|uniref:Uncharacterized protein n=1 Tax=Streptomyces capitiformicae TaxID=2014920 RepID=A0A919DMT6_9ACTN|nr:hypothetical protein GCM10017771_87730 [Streptomyces capitiformicae]